MKTKVPHNILTISEMTRRPSRITAETIEMDDLILTDEIIKKLRASSSMFNKSTYVQIMCDGIRYNVESVDKQKNGNYRILLISPFATATLLGNENSSVRIKQHRML